MRFSLYSELQLHPGKTPSSSMREVLEQIVNADRLGYDCYASIEHFFFPKFSISANPTALFAAAAQRTRNIRFRTMLHALPYHNPTVLACAIHTTDILTGGRYEWGVGRGHGWIPEKAGVPLDEHARPRYEEAVDLLFAALDNERFSHHGEYFDVDDSHVVPFLDPQLPRLPRRHLRPHVRARGRARLGRRGAAAPALQGARAAARPLPRDVRRARHDAGHRLDPRVPPRRGPRHRDARGPRLDHRLHPGQLLAAHRVREAAGGRARSRPATASTRPGSWSSSPRCPFEQLVEDDYVWVGTPDDIIARIEETREVCEGVKEIGITVNAGGAPHWMAIKNQELFAESDAARRGAAWLWPPRPEP